VILTAELLASSSVCLPGEISRLIEDPRVSVTIVERWFDAGVARGSSIHYTARQRALPIAGLGYSVYCRNRVGVEESAGVEPIFTE
jgi:hypothetical protein